MVSLVLQALIGILHPLYVSLTDIHHNPKEKIVEVSVRIFTDDLEAVLRTTTKEIVNLSGDKHSPAMDSLVKKYIQKNIGFTINGKPCQLKYVGFEEQSESIWTYLEINGVETIKNVQLVNTILYDYKKAEQINMVNCVANGLVLNTKISYPSNRATFNF